MPAPGSPNTPPVPPISTIDRLIIAASLIVAGALIGMFSLVVASELRSKHGVHVASNDRAVKVETLTAPQAEPSVPRILGQQAASAESPEEIDPIPSASDDAQPTPIETPDSEPENVPTALASLPWAEAVDSATPSVDWRELCFRPFDTRRVLPQPDTLKDWFEAVAGFPFDIHPTDTSVGRCGQLHANSVARLRAPLDQNTTLRVALDHHNRLRIHCYHGMRGVTLTYYEHDNYRWAAYATMREPGKVLPTHAALTSTDDARARRTEVRYGGPLELRYRDGEMILSRGEVPLLRAPLPGPPEDVYFQGQVAFHGIELVRTRGFPAASQDLPVVWSSDSPQNLSWTPKLSKGSWIEPLPDGAIALLGEHPAEKSYLTTPLKFDGICSITLGMEDVSPGTGVFFEMAGGQTHEVLRFVRNQYTGRTCLMLRGNDDGFEHGCNRMEENFEPCIGQQVWVKMLFGCGTLRWWISIDGHHWAEPDLGWSDMRGNVAAIGIQHVARIESARIQVHDVAVRRLSRLSSLADAELLAQARSAHDLPNLPAWIDTITPHKPAGVDHASWRRTCAVKTLAVGPTRELGHALVALLLDDSRTREKPIEQQLDLLDEAALLLDLRDDYEELQRFVARYHQLGRNGFEQGLPAFSTALPHLLKAPVGTRQTMKLGETSLMRTELLQSLTEQRWDDTLSFCQTLRFYHWDESFPLVDWADSTARRESPGADGRNVTRMKESWQHPLVEQLDKPTYNLLNELHAMLGSDAVEDAARLITAIEPGDWQGVATSVDDSRLLTSLPTAVDTCLREHDELRRLIGEQYDPLARLRIRQAIQRRDQTTLRLCTVQFQSTPAVVEAYRWLGDQALVLGAFDQARAWYQRESDASPIGVTPDLSARLRLAAALRGERWGEPATQPVSFAETTMSASEFEAMVEDLIVHRSSQAEHSQAASGTPELPKPGALHVDVRARLDGPLGDDPRREVTRHVKTYDIDWAGRQIDTVVDGDTLYVSNRFQIAAYDLNNGARKWQSPQIPGKRVQPAQAWTSIAMRPLVAADEIYARMLYGEQPCLVCIDKSNGSIRWVSELSDFEAVASDPLLVREQLMAFSCERSEQQATLLRLTKFDRESGQVLDRHEIVQLRDSWWQRSNASTSQIDDGLIVSLGGATLCCSNEGELRWIRKQVVLPADEDSEWVKQHYLPPIIHEDVAFVGQPGVASVEAINVGSGRLRWSRLMPEIRRVVGVRGERLVLETEQGFCVVSRSTGDVLWEHAASDRLVGLALSDMTLLFSRRDRHPDSRDRFRVQFIWLDIASGSITGREVFDQLEDPDPRFGPLLVHKDRLWAFFGRGHFDAARDFVEIHR